MLSQRNIRVIGPIYKSITDRTIVGYNLASPSVVRKDASMKAVREAGFNVVDTDERTSHFKITA